MKKINRARLLIVALTVLALFILTLALMPAQAGPPPTPCDPLDPLCPVDGGVLVLLTAGIGLGGKSFKKN